MSAQASASARVPVPRVDLFEIHRHLVMVVDRREESLRLVEQGLAGLDLPPSVADHLLALVTGFVGMNVTFPLEGTAAGFWVYLAVMIAAALVLYVVLKLRHWL